MNLYCTKEFKTQFLQLKKKNNYQDLEKIIIDYFFGKTIEELKDGRLLNGSETHPFIKKRLPHASGYRLYFYIIIKDDCLYLTWVHPKTGPMGDLNVGPVFKKKIQKDVIAAAENKDIYTVSVSKEKDELEFTEYEEEIPDEKKSTKKKK